jgi:hypothetical protein
VCPCLTESQNLYVAIGRRLASVPEGALLTGANAAAFCEADPGKGNSVFHMKLRCMESCTCIADLLSNDGAGLFDAPTVEPSEFPAHVAWRLEASVSKRRDGID